MSFSETCYYKKQTTLILFSTELRQAENFLITHRTYLLPTTALSLVGLSNDHRFHRELCAINSGSKLKVHLLVKKFCMFLWTFSDHTGHCPA